MVTLRHDGQSGARQRLHDLGVVVTRLDGRWRVECEERVAESAYLEAAIAEALVAHDDDPFELATQLLDQHHANG